MNSNFLAFFLALHRSDHPREYQLAGKTNKADDKNKEKDLEQCDGCMKRTAYYAKDHKKSSYQRSGSREPSRRDGSIFRRRYRICRIWHAHAPFAYKRN